MFYVLKSSDVLEILVPILYYLNDARADQCKSRIGDVIVLCLNLFNFKELVAIVNVLLVARVGLMHIGVFILLLLSGERNFGVRLNKPYSVRVPMDIPVFTGTHADFLIIVRPSSTMTSISPCTLACIYGMWFDVFVQSVNILGFPQDHHNWSPAPATSL